jgi:tetratricopeptide (TPR) repeat protein
MHSDPRWQRAVLLTQQQRWPLAIRELRGLLAESPEHTNAHALLALALAHDDDLPAAVHAAQQAITLDPGSDFAHRSLAVVRIAERRFDDAAEAITTAIHLAPDEVDHRAILAQIRLSQRRWAEALDAADQGLALDAEDVDCLNLRSIALSKLGRGAEATDTVDASLRKDPDNPLTHQARGFALLHRGHPEEALHHFQEALRRDPSLDGARAGLVEALKAHNPIYRLVLAWFLWLDGKARGHQFAIVIGAFLAARFGGDALANAGHTTAATVVRLSWLGVVLVTSCAVPLFNLLLLLHPIGRHALERAARRHALLLGATLLVTTLVVLGGALGGPASLQHGWPFWLLFLLPVSGLGLFHRGWAQAVLATFCVVAIAAWCWWAWRLEEFATAVQGLTERPDVDAATVAATAMKPRIEEHAELLWHLVRAVAFSTWFVLLVPKGTPPRRRGAG